MAKAKRSSSKRQSISPKPKDFLNYAEGWAVRIRRAISSKDYSVPTDDLVRILLLIEQLARKGKNATGVEAREYASKIDVLKDQALTELAALLHIDSQNAE